MNVCVRADKANGIPEHRICGLDIGTGSSAIYPLLGCGQNPNWDFVATELDEKSWTFANENVRKNNLQSRIQVLKARPEEPILAPLQHKCFDFTMCNPPFYTSRGEILQASKAKDLPPSAACTGAEVEMITEGGEVRFVGRMVEESSTLKTQCRWFTSMLGKLSSVSEIISQLHQHSISNYAITEFVQGQTRRWAVAWSFIPMHLPDAIARISNPTLAKVLPPRNSMIQDLPSAPESGSTSQIIDLIHKIVSSTEGVDVVEGHENTLLVTAAQNTWSRSARRQRMAGDTAMQDLTIHPKLVCAIRINDHMQLPREHQRVKQQIQRIQQLQIDWMYGENRALFESFASHVSRKTIASMRTTS
ncbi:hypothetical protein AX16_002524 [Volvariella volvacea WC 439]|nr:hypothetical protein AX16_002524 [Volvariella volvacea WC 439]